MKFKFPTINNVVSREIPFAKFGSRLYTGNHNNTITKSRDYFSLHQIHITHIYIMEPMLATVMSSFVKIYILHNVTIRSNSYDFLRQMRISHNVTKGSNSYVTHRQIHIRRIKFPS